MMTKTSRKVAAHPHAKFPRPSPQSHNPGGALASCMRVFHFVQQLRQWFGSGVSERKIKK
eukprot:708812-Amphidinium_carterae.1